jgi:hypothetical protein
MLADIAIPISKRTTVPRFQATEETSIRMVLSCRHTRRRVGKACRVCRALRATPSVIGRIPSRPCSHPPTNTRPTFSTT